MDSRKYFVAAVGLIAVTTGIWLSSRVLSPPPLPQTATMLPAPTDIARFSLLDQDGATFTQDSFAGRWNLVFFGFTHCPDVCPLTLQVLAQARQKMLDDGNDKAPRIVLISVDPERDTPAVIGKYVANFGDDVIGVSGELSELRKLTGSLGIYFEKSAVDDDNYSVDHSAVVIVVDPDGRFHSLFGSPHKVENFMHDLPIIMSTR